jgi:hypothetical protein
MGTFRFSYLADFMRRDILGKVIPWFVLYAAGKLTDKSPIPGIDFKTLADTAFGIIVAALIGSIAASLVQLGLSKQDAKQNASGQVPGTGVKGLLGPENPAAGHG